MLVVPDSALKIAAGIYTHTSDGLPNNVTERWVCSRSNELTWLQIDYRKPDGEIAAVAQLSGTGQIERFTYEMHTVGQPAIVGDYELQARMLRVVRRFGHDAVLEDHIPFTEQLILDPPFLSTKGYTLAALRGAARQPTYAPLLALGERAGDLAKKATRERDEETVQLLGIARTLRHIEYGYDYWVDADNIVWRALATAHHYEMVLTEYERY